ncbi:MAG: DNA-formamidopyrimidine glycosylase family protein [Acidimicrobiia bacterium]|nr:DNA-formamidopyrimidine glycosylase family protein [Acidimicrobiia bacterium]
MPELPEIVAYLDALEPRVLGEQLERVRVSSFSLMKTFDPPIDDANGRTVVGLERIGKRIVLKLDGDRALVIHLMVAGRLHWEPPGKAIPRKYGQAAFDFADGTLMLTEAGTKRRASLHYVAGEDALRALDPGGTEVIGSTLQQFSEGLLAERHTLKRALSDARYLSGIGGAFADEILHRAKLSPLQMNTNLDEEEIARLHDAAVTSLTEWIEIRRADTGDGFPKKVTAFHPKMAVHGKYGEPCPVCEAPIQRIVYASRETNYCPGCQTGGKILADRSLSRLLKDDWPSTLEELEG